jgi:hypothetical protein
MKIIGLLSWYEEPVSWLAETVASAAKLCDHLIAVDGPYAEFPFAHTKPASGTDQVEIILHTAAGSDMGCTIHAPREPWFGNEVEKRTTMFDLAMPFTTEDDWLFVIDADEIVTDHPDDVRERLGELTVDVAEVQLWERGDQDDAFTARRFFRALRGLKYDGCHYVVTASSGDGVKVLSGDPKLQHLEPAGDMGGVRMEHRSNQRTALRTGFKNQYYAKLPELEQVKNF